MSQLNHPEPDSNPEDGAREKEKVVEFIGRCLKAQFHMFASLPEAVLRELLNKLVYRHFKEPTAIVSQVTLPQTTLVVNESRPVKGVEDCLDNSDSF